MTLDNDFWTLDTDVLWGGSGRSTRHGIIQKRARDLTKRRASYNQSYRTTVDYLFQVFRSDSVPSTDFAIQYGAVLVWYSVALNLSWSTSLGCVANIHCILLLQLKGSFRPHCFLLKSLFSLVSKTIVTLHQLLICLMVAVTMHPVELSQYNCVRIYTYTSARQENIRHLNNGFLCQNNLSIINTWKLLM